MLLSWMYCSGNLLLHIIPIDGTVYKIILVEKIAETQFDNNIILFRQFFLMLSFFCIIHLNYGTVTFSSESRLLVIYLNNDTIHCAINVRFKQFSYVFKLFWKVHLTSRYNICEQKSICNDVELLENLLNSLIGWKLLYSAYE